MNAWDQVLLQWCNCLELSKEIGDLNELRNGDFFTNLYGIISSSEIQNEDTMLTRLLCFLKGKYVNFQTEGMHYSSFSELTEDELRFFTSLLMHYTCIYDRREALTSPLCKKLSKNTQLQIRNFLEMVRDDITNLDFSEIIDQYNKEVIDPSCSTTGNISSPLTGILNKPFLKIDMNEKDREITKLKNMLELERYEKTDVQEELKHLSEKCKKLEILLTKSNADAISLKRKITALECKTPPHFNTIDSVEKIRILEKHVQSLEHYIEKNEKEEDELREEYYKNKKKLSEWELEYTLLKTKCSNFEKKVEELSTLTNQQSTKIDFLENHCEELSGLLEEFQRKPENDSSFFETSSVHSRRSLTLVEENLACSVVEVQLKEALNKNEEMVLQIDSLNNELGSNRKLLEAKIKDYEELNGLHQKATIEIESMKHTCKEHSSEIKELASKLKIAEEINEEYSAKLQSLEEVLEERNTECNKVMSHMKEYLSEIESLKCTCNEHSLEIQELTTKLKTSEEVNEEYTAKLLSLGEVLEQRNIEFDKVVSDMNGYLSEIESLKHSSKLLNEQIDSLNNELGSNRKLLKDKIKDYEELGSLHQKASDEIESLKHTCKVNSSEIQDLTLKLKTAEEANEEYSTKLQSLEEVLEQKNTEFDKIVSDTNEYLSEIESLKHRSKLLNEQIASLNDELGSNRKLLEDKIEDYEELSYLHQKASDEIESLKHTCKENSSEILALTSKLKTAEEANKEYTAKLQSLEKVLEQKNTEFDKVVSDTHEYLSEIESLKHRGKLLNEQIESLNDELGSHRKLLEDKIKDYEELSNLHQKASDEIESLKHTCEENSSEIQELTSKLKTAEEANKEYSAKLQSLEEVLEQKNTEFDKIVSNLNEYLSEIESLKYSRKSLSEQIDSLKNDLESNRKLLKDKVEDYEELNSLHQKASDEIKSLKNTCNENSLEIQEVTTKLRTTEEVIKEYTVKLQSHEEVLEQRNTQFDKVISDMNEYLSEIESLKHSGKLLNEQIASLNDELGSNRKLLEDKIKDYEELSNLHQKASDEIESLKHTCKENSSEIQGLTSKLKTAEGIIKEYNAKLQALEEVLEQKNTEFDKVVSDMNEYLSEIELLKQSKKSLSEQIDSFNNELGSNRIFLEDKIKDYEELNSLHQKASVEIESLQHTCEEYSSEIRDLTSQLKISEEANKEYTTKLKSLEEVLGQKNTEFDKVTSDMNNYLSEIQSLKHNSELLSEQIQDLISKLTASEETNREYSAELQRLQESIKKNKIEFDQAILEKNRVISEYSDRIVILQEEFNEKKNILDYKDKLVKEYTNDCRKFQLEITKIKESTNEFKEYHKSETVKSNERLYQLGQIFKQLKQALNINNDKLEYYEQHTKELNEKIRESNKILMENKSLKEDYIALIKTVSMYNEELNKIVKNLKGYNQQPSSELSDLQIAYNQFNKLNQLHSPAKNRSVEDSDKINELGEQISKVNAYIHMFAEKETFYVKEIDHLKEELSAANNNYFDLTQNLKEQNCDNEYQIKSLTENLHSVIEKYNQLQLEHRDYLNKINECEVEMTKLKKMHSDITINHELKITDLQRQILKYHEEILSLNRIRDSMNENYQMEMKKFEEELSRSGEETESLRAEIERIKAEYESEINGLKMKLVEYEEAKLLSEKKLEDISVEHALQIETMQSQILKKEEDIRCLKEECDEKESKLVSIGVQLSINKEEISKLRNRTSKTEEEYESTLASLQVQVVSSKLEITELKNKKDELLSEKERLAKTILELEEEKMKQMTEKKLVEDALTEERKTNELLRNELSLNETQLEELKTLKGLREKCEKLENETLNKKFLEEKQKELQQKIDTLIESSEVQKKTYEVFKLYYQHVKENLDKLLSQKNILETLTNSLRVLVVSINKNVPAENFNLKRLLEKKEAMEIISEDIMKQYNRYSKQINDLVFDVIKYYEKNCDNLLSTLDIKIENYLEKYNLEELNNNVSDLTERTADALEQIKILQKDLDNLSKAEEDLNIQKENILGTSRKINVDKMKEDELKKKNLTLRQKVTLLENSKSNLEKTVKKLREENKRLKEGDNKACVPDNDIHYKMLLQEYITFKENHEEILKDYKTKLVHLQQELEGYKNECMRTSTPFGLEHILSEETKTPLQADLAKLQEAYANIRMINAKLEAENMYSKKLIEGHKQEIGKFNLIKEAYDKLLEENNKLMTDVDTMKYKRARDRDEFLRLLRKEKSDNDSKHTKQIQDIKTEYEAKLERMKEKMIKLYRDEVNKEMNRVKAGHHESSSLLKMIEQLKGDLFEAEQKVQLLEMEREILKRNQDQSSNSHTTRESFSAFRLHDSDTRSLRDFSSSSISSMATSAKPKSNTGKLMEFKHPSKVNPSSLDTRKQYDERRVSTLPRTGTVIEEVTISRRTSIGVPDSIGHTMQMEDEEEMFNNKYLMDLKQGKCDLPSSGDRDSRVSELAWRNSMVPPHLKSSYPAEMQFCSPGRYKEDDIKTGNIPFDDSLSKLLPGDKPRKKDFGTTSYKKPGPPTPSKNGGRLSLQGNEVHPAREPPSEPKRSTPSRIRALFTGRNSSKSSSETSPPRRRFFRR